MCNEEVYIGRNLGVVLQVWPCRDAVEFDSVVFHSTVLQIEDTTRDEVSCPCWLLVEYAVVIARDEDSQLRRDGSVPLEEALQRLRTETFAGVTGTDENVGVGRNAEAPVHPMSIGESKDLMAFVLDEHYRFLTKVATACSDI